MIGGNDENKMSVIELQHIKKSYADGNQMHDVIKDLSLTVEPQNLWLF